MDVETIVKSIKKKALEVYGQMDEIDDPVWKMQCSLRATILIDVATAIEKANDQ